MRYAAAMVSGVRGIPSQRQAANRALAATPSTPTGQSVRFGDAPEDFGSGLPGTGRDVQRTGHSIDFAQGIPGASFLARGPKPFVAIPKPFHLALPFRGQRRTKGVDIPPIDLGREPVIISTADHRHIDTFPPRVRPVCMRAILVDRSFLEHASTLVGLACPSFSAPRRDPRTLSPCRHVPVLVRCQRLAFSPFNSCLLG